ncbi:hypothetical protein JMN32_19185 [Fulvivirga sp. 29W222]|uniref:DUF3857 domain-containing protein n=1 Tax=Fulvivirga marina TaxID=2494733 RepID=A0A937G1H3_9BACT|nr:DUF3857 domain-containing protein [Fulvivirga marina]MBL6448446.1 hypothetical protein [Fulvivirga marina]
MRIIVILSFVFASLLVNAQEHAKVLSQKTVYNIKSIDNVEIQKSYSIVINSKKGYHWAVFRDYFDEFKTIKNLNMTIRDGASGEKVKKFNKGDALTLGFSSSYEINDSKTLYLDPDYHNYPFIVEVSVDIKIKGFTALPVWIPRPYFNLSVDNASLELIVDDNVNVKIKEENITLHSEKKTEEGTSKLYSVSSLPHQDQKIRFKEFFEQQPRVYVKPLEFQLDGVVGSTESWKDFGEWFLALNSDSYVLTAETKTFIDALPKGNKKQVIDEVYGYMQDKVRYISIQLGIGGFKSISTEEVEATGYGDCKALTTYMKNMLDYAGINSNYILVYAGSDVPDVLTDFPGNQFNHVFLGIPLAMDTVYLECTSQIVPSNYIGTFTDNRNVLWIAKGNSQLIQSRTYTYQDNIEKNFAKISVDDKGKGKIALSTENRGILFDDIMVYKYGKENHIRDANISKFSYKDFTINNFSYNQDDKKVAAFTSKFSIEVTGIGRKVADKLITSANLLKPIDKYLDYNEYLGYADILRGITVEDSVELLFQDKYWVNKLPQDVSLTSEFGSYTMTFEANEDKLIVRRKFFFTKGKYIEEQFSEFSSFVNKIKAAEKAKIVMDSKT